ncbi:MAG: hypothetical protein O3B01_31920 [Planctomycetota bacterium]|nr:hypothetical protein [Planctomycetota bacterium]MDA1143190.1 hypothetical protein [Planctomycetota bacterium]
MPGRNTINARTRQSPTGRYSRNKKLYSRYEQDACWWLGYGAENLRNGFVFLLPQLIELFELLNGEKAGPSCHSASSDMWRVLSDMVRFHASESGLSGLVEKSLLTDDGAATHVDSE